MYNDRKEAGAKLKSLISANAARIADGKDFEICEYRGFKLSIFFDTLSKHVKACLGGEDLHVEMNGDVFTICQTYEQNGDLMYDPRIDLKVDYDNQKVIPLSFENSGMGVYQEYDISALTPEVARDMNDALEFMDGNMLDQIEEAGYKPA